MSKKSREKKKAQKAQRNARDIQTPAPTEVGSEHESQQSDSSRAQELRPKASRDTNGKAPERRARFARSPTREGDFATNATDYESNGETDLELSDASDQSAPIEHKLEPLSRWVKNVIRRETAKQSERMVEEFFTSSTPMYQECQEFFQKLNQHIRGANSEHSVIDLDTGTIPETGYNTLCHAWQQAAKKSAESLSPEEFWEAFNETHRLIRIFNKRHYLPKTWNISEAWAEQQIKTPNPRIEEDTSSTSDSGDIQSDSDHDQLPAGHESSDESSTESDIEIGSDKPTGLDALEARTLKQQRQLDSAKVLYWWPKGTGSQIFVRYGSKSTPIYRIRAGSHESYNPSRVERVLTMTRGTAKVAGVRNGLREEFWKYKRRDVEDFIGIGWKVEGDDEQGVYPLDLLLPAKGITYPQTRILVKWKDGIYTLEGRSFIRRITNGSTLDGDRVIYQKAEELETAYRKKHLLYDIEDDDIDPESDGSTQPIATRNRRYRSGPARYSSSRSRRNHIVASSDEENDVSTQSRQTRDRRYLSEPARYSNPRSQNPRHRSEPTRYSDPRSRRTTTPFDITDEDSDVIRTVSAGREPRKTRRYQTNRRGSTA